MKSSSSVPPSRSSVTGSLGPSRETASHDDDDASPLRRHTPNNTAGTKSPRSIHFVAPANDDGGGGGGDEKDSRPSNVLSPNGSLAAMDHDDDGGGGGGDFLAHAASPPLQRQEELPRFHLTREDVEAAFEFLDVNGSGLLTMSNLKQRLSAFYPQLTSKEYKFLVEDPSGSNGVGGVGSSNNTNNNQSISPEPPGLGQAFISPFSAEGLRASSRPAKAGANEPIGAGGTPGHGEAAVSTAEQTGQQSNNNNGVSSRVCGSRAGLDVDQLWDLIHSFQQLQTSISSNSNAGGGATRMEAPQRQTASSGGARRHGSPGGVGGASYDANMAAALLQSSGEASFDAVGEAFRVYDPRNTHYVEKEVLSRIMAQIGFGELSEEDLTLLVGTADFDGDGRISLDDFRRLVNMKGRFKDA